jgi:hypothetical protein
MSHLTARCSLAGFELYQQGAAPAFILPGEQHAPATSDLEQDFLLRRGVPLGCILNLPNRDGTLQQLEPVARLQRQARLGRVIVVCFAFHIERVCAYLRLLGIHGEVAEVEQTHVAFLRARSGSVRVTRDVLVDLPQLGPVRRAEHGISRRLLVIDRPFGRLAPATRLFKALAGPTITDVERGRARVGLVRLVAARELVDAIQQRARRGWPRRPDHAPTSAAQS